MAPGVDCRFAATLLTGFVSRIPPTLLLFAAALLGFERLAPGLLAFPLRALLFEALRALGVGHDHESATRVQHELHADPEMRQHVDEACRC
jgi:hypothetical protein